MKQQSKQFVSAVSGIVGKVSNAYLLCFLSLAFGNRPDDCSSITFFFVTLSVCLGPSLKYLARLFSSRFISLSSSSSSLSLYSSVSSEASLNFMLQSGQEAVVSHRINSSILPTFDYSPLNFKSSSLMYKETK